MRLTVTYIDKKACKGIITFEGGVVTRDRPSFRLNAGIKKHAGKERPKDRLETPPIKMPRLLNTPKFSFIRYVLIATMITAFGTVWPTQVWSEHSGTVVALVNGSPIYQYDLGGAVESENVRGQLSQQKRSTTKRILDMLIEAELLYQESLKHKFHGLTEAAEKHYRDSVVKAGGGKQFRSALSCNDMTPDRWRQSVFRKLSINRLLDKVVYSKIVIKPGEIRKYYELNQDKFITDESFHLRQIFVRGPDSNDQMKWRAINKKALEIVRSARSGTSFIRLARRYSNEPSGANNGGDMGVVHKGNIPSSLNTVLFNLEDGAVTEPVRSRNGFYIYNVVERIPATVMPFEAVEDRIHTHLRKKRALEMTRALLDELKSRADIVITGQR